MFFITLINQLLLKLFLQHDRSLAVRILELMSQTQGNFTHYKEIFLLALMLTTPKEINDNKLLVCPGSIRKFNIEQLLMFGADVHVTYYNGQTLLMSACLYGNTRTCESCSRNWSVVISSVYRR